MKLLPAISALSVAYSTIGITNAQEPAQDPNFLICRNTKPKMRAFNPIPKDPVKPIGCCPPNDPDGKLYGPNKACCCDKVYKPDEAFCCQPTGTCDEFTMVLKHENAHVCEDLKLQHAEAPKFCEETSGPNGFEGKGEMAVCTNSNEIGSTCGLECRPGFARVNMEEQNDSSWKDKKKAAPIPIEKMEISKKSFECNADGKWDVLDAVNFKGLVGLDADSDEIGADGSDNNNNECCLPVCPPTLPSTSKADFFIVLDKSSSIRLENFDYVKQFMLKIMGTFPLGPDNVQVRLSTYNSIVENVFELDESATLPLTSINNKINSINYNGKGTNTGTGLIDVVDNALFKPTNRPDVEDYLLLVTDGRSKQAKIIAEAVEKLKAAGVKILVIGVGDQVRKNELSRIASEPVEDNLRIIRDYAALVTMSDWVLSTQCPVLSC